MSAEQQQVSVGVYVDQHRHTAIVLRNKNGQVTFLSMNQTRSARASNGLVSYEAVTQNVDVSVLPTPRFAEQYHTKIKDYPLLRALKKYWESGLHITADAERVIGVALRNLQS